MKKNILILALLTLVFCSTRITLAEEAVGDAAPPDTPAVTDETAKEKPEALRPMATIMATTTIGTGPTQAFKSSENFQVEPTTGTATINIPVAIPAGRKGIQPSVALTYNSGLPNGPLGVGWNLELGAIQRSAKKGVPDYGPNNTYTLLQGGGSQDLTSIGADQYRAKIEGAFMDFSQQGLGWVVRDKKGIKYYFGTTADSRIVDPTDQTHIFKWCLDRVEDLNGNYLIIEYLKDQNQLYPRFIRYIYTSPYPSSDYHAEVELVYNQAKSDYFESYLPGFKVVTAKQLDDIYVRVDGNLIRRYRLIHENAPNSQKRILTAMDQSDDQGEFLLPSTTFQYQYLLTTWDTVAGWSVPAVSLFGQGNFMDKGVRLADYDADGFMDMLVYALLQGGEEYRYVLHNNKNAGWDEVSDWQMPNGTNFTENRGSYVADMGVRLADVNGDGYVDILKNFGGNKNIYLNNKVDGWGTPRGTPDAVWNMPADTEFVRDIPSSQENLGVVLADVNGDGLVDIVKAKGSDRRAYLNNGSGWQESSSWAPPSGVDFSTGAYQFADVNADGLPDIVRAESAGKQTFINHGLADPTTNNRWVRGENWDIPGGYANFTDGSTVIEDVNGDRLADIVIAAGSSTNNYCYINTGHSWFLDSNRSNYINNYNRDNSNYPIDLRSGRTRIFDINGDGLADMLEHYYLDQGYMGARIHINQGPFNDRYEDTLYKMDNGIGGVTQIAYKPSTKYANTLLPFPILTVSSSAVSDGQGHTYSTDYNYAKG
ncbi:MAG: SpvB/TcaC N-terminal domain-containing protein, partial [Candidatus Omnitrophota bacterium]